MNFITRYPEGTKEPVVQEGPEPTEQEVSNAISSSTSDAIAGSKGKVGILLSGGVDSTLLLHYATKYGKVEVFTVATDVSHPDLQAAEEVAKQYGLKHHVLLPSHKELEEAKKELKGRGELFKGDAGMYLALKLAKSKGVTTILASEGIDELTGGYWWHAKPNVRFSSKEEAFKSTWNRLVPDHVSPLLDSARRVNIEIKFPFLDKRVVTTLNRIPLDRRTEGGVPKSWWKDFAAKRISGEVVSRQKIGGSAILEEEITDTLPRAIQWETDYQISDQRVRGPYKSSRVRQSRTSVGRIASKEVRL